MPRFFFDIREGPRFTRDHEGLTLRDLDHAEREAAIAAAEIGRDALPRGDAEAIGIEVRDEDGRVAVAVMVSMRVKRLKAAEAR